MALKQRIEKLEAKLNPPEPIRITVQVVEPDAAGVLIDVLTGAPAATPRGAKVIKVAALEEWER